jgi:hypothetical protein
MRKALFCLMLVVVMGSMPPAHAAEVTIEGFATLTYQDQVKLKVSGCQDLRFSYTTEEDLARENTVFLVQLVHKSKKQIYGGAVWFSEFTSKGPDALPSMSRIGTLKIKVCRNSWVMGAGALKEKFPAVSPGSYRLYFAGGYVDPETGAKTGDKVEVFRTLKLS